VPFYPFLIAGNESVVEVCKTGWPAHTTFGGVNFQVKMQLNKPAYFSHNPICRAFAFSKNAKVVSITDKAKPPAFQFFVQIVQYNIG
jgi:hypothetical protein